VTVSNILLCCHGKPSIRQIVGTKDVIEVFSMIPDSGVALAVERQTASGPTYQTVEITFSGEVINK